jgi:ubiquinone/menaquinone biosynthesis C-methylase UbiE
MFRRLVFILWYLQKPPWDSGISPPELLEFINTHPADKAIDLGCGTGTNVITLARAGWQVTGVDFAPKAIRIARQKLKKVNIQADLHVGDVTKLKDISGRYMFALDIGCFHSLPQSDRREYLTQLDRILSPNGFWLLYSFISPNTHHSLPGLGKAEIDMISTRFTRLSRQNGFNNGERPSAWFLFQKEEPHKV